MRIQYRILNLGMGTPQPAVVPGGGGGRVREDRGLDPRYRGLRKAWPTEIAADSMVSQPVAIVHDLEAPEPLPEIIVEPPRPKKPRRHLVSIPPAPPIQIAGPAVAFLADPIGAPAVVLAAGPGAIASRSQVAHAAVTFQARPAAISRPRAARRPPQEAPAPIRLGVAPVEPVARIRPVSRAERIKKLGRKPPPPRSKG